MVNDAPRNLAGRYEVGELIGRGGMAEVHIGHDARLGRTVAIKILRSDLARDPSFQARFRREAQAAASLNHPAIVAVYDTGEDTVTDKITGAVSHVPFIVMEYVEGRTVRDILKDGNAVPIDEAIEITDGILSALEYSHRAGIVHRDIKPANVMLTTTGAIKVMDFGIARALADSAATMTQTQAVIGTAQYLSPEQAKGENVDARSDIYSTGCLLYELLTGRAPFTGDNPVSVAYQHVREVPQPPSAIASDVPKSLDLITMRALEKDRELRYSSADEFRKDLERAQNGAALAPVAVPNGETTQLLPQDQPTMIAAQPAWANVGVSTTGPTAATGINPVVPDDEGGSRKALWWTIGAIVVVALAVIIGFFLLGNDNDPDDVAPATIAVPDLSGTTAEQATAALTEAGFTSTPVIRNEASVTVPENLFIKSEPGKGIRVAPDQVITLTFSTGPDAVTIPDLTDKDRVSAVALLREAGLEADDAQSSENSATIERDKVTRTEPTAGESVAAGTKVKLFFSTGLVDLPDLSGKTQAEVEATLSELHLSGQFSSEPSESTLGTVIGQEPGAGSVNQGSSVRITLAAEPKPEKVTIPSNLRNMTLEEATSVLKNLGLVVKTEEADHHDLAKNRVAGYVPGAGEQVDVGSTVTLYLSNGSAHQSNDNAPSASPTN